jgi:tetratricopeptide (TPR) repeat protein
MKKNKEKTIQKTNENSVLIWIGLVAIILLGLFIYSNSHDCSFQFDDKHNITNNETIRNISNIKEMWESNKSRIVPVYTFAINYHFSKYNVGSYHLLNIIIHLIASCLVFWIIRLLFKSPILKDHSLTKHQTSIALITALMFVSHPLATSAVTYIVQRMASMVAMFYLLSIGFYLKGRLNKEKAVLYYSLAGITALFAFLTKENAYTLPLAIALIEIFFFTTKNIVIDFKDKKIVFALLGTVAFIVITLSIFSFSIFNPIAPSSLNRETITSSNYFITQLGVIVKYLQLLILPINQNIDHDVKLTSNLFELSTLLSGLFLVSLVALAIYLFNKNRIVSFGIIWFFLTISIESSIIPITDLIFEHRTYLPSFGFYLIVSSIIYQYIYSRNKGLTTALFVFIIGSYSLLTIQRNKVWKDEISLWTDANIKAPNKVRPFLNLGYAYGNKQQWDKAIYNFNNVNRLEPNYHAAAYSNLGIAYWAIGQKEKSMENYSIAIKVDSTYADAYYGRGVCYYYLNDQDKSLQDYSKALKYLQRPELYFNRGLIYSNKKMWNEAITDFSKAISTTPENSSLYYNRGLAYGGMNQWELAADDFTKTLELDPQNKSAESNREFAFSKLKETANKK